MIGDMIVNLYMKDLWSTKRKFNIQRIFPSDKERVLKFIEKIFPGEKRWIMEAEHAWYEGTLYIAVESQKIIGFACYDCSGKGYFGPFGVFEEYRGKGVGTELLYACLDAMKQIGYGYAIIGWVADKEDDINSPLEFYKKTTMAMYIPYSDPHYTLYKRRIQTENISLQGYDYLDAFKKWGDEF